MEKQREELREVIDWKQFDWDKFKSNSRGVLTQLHERWIEENPPPELMNAMLVESLTKMVDEVAKMKKVCCYSRPWIDELVARKIKEVKKIKKKFEKHRSQLNAQLLEEARREVTVEISEAWKKWMVKECSKLSSASESER